MTKKLYDIYPYETEFKATVLSCTKYNNVYDVILDQTLFFPEEGGQTCDKGFINNFEVVDVQIKNGIIHHYVEEAISDTITGKIDWKHRFSNMQNHSGEHILSGLVNSLFGYNNVGFHLGNDEVTADYDHILSNEQMQILEEKVNEIIIQNIPIYCWYPENPQEIDYRSKKEINEAIRIVDIPDVDTCACCAPHVKSTAEIGLFKILKGMKHKKGTRLYFLCGNRAIENYKVIYNQAQMISNLFSAPIDNIYSSANRINDEVYNLKQEIIQLKKQMIDEQTKNLVLKDSYIIFDKNLDMNTQKYYLNKLKPYVNDYAAIFVEQENNYRFLLVSNKDARIQLKQLKEKFNLRGGGKQDNIQGTIEASEQEILNILKGDN